LLSGKGWLAIAFVVIVAGSALFATPRLEGTPPSIESQSPWLVGGAGRLVTIAVADEGAGLRSVEVRLVHPAGAQMLIEKSFAGGLALGSTGAARAIEVKIPIEPEALGLSDGDATLEVSVRDWSWRDGLQGNRTDYTIPISIDTQAPRIKTAPGLVYIYRGGAGTAIYRLSEEAERDGVQVGDAFYRGFPLPGAPASELRRVAIFAVPIEAPASSKVEVVAEDLAGNQARAAVRARVFDRKFPKEDLKLSSRFFEGVVPGLAGRVGVDERDPVKAFQIINRDIRARNEARIRELTQETSPTPLWQGAFKQMPSSKVMSRFAEQRHYFSDGREISQATHYGFDLASTSGAQINAANAGVVVFAADLGIYGNCVVVDHGLGLSSLYGHLSELAVEPGQQVQKGQALGRSGSTGLAGGDHLHFAMLVGNTYVDPLEWWDPKWVRDHIEVRLQAPGG
jgi:murein DD-endopeptidase MepM/ murein hydrolase activator NlpD